jgi:hypothetical protein
MWRKLGLLAVACSLAPWAATYAQDPQPSLGDVARQNRKDKEAKKAAAAKTVVTDETLPSGKAAGGFSDLSGSRGSAGGDPIAKGNASLDQVEGTLDKLAPMDRTTLAKAALLDNDVEFPNRRAWEGKLYAAKEEYVTHGRELVREMRQLMGEVQSVKAQKEQGTLNSNDPRVQELVHKLQELMQDAMRTDSAYQSVVMEGWDLAKQAKR